MYLFLGGLAILASGLALLLAQVSRILEPGLVLSLLAYAAAFGGTLLALAGLLRRSGHPGERHGALPSDDSP